MTQIRCSPLSIHSMASLGIIAVIISSKCCPSKNDIICSSVAMNTMSELDGAVVMHFPSSPPTIMKPAASSPPASRYMVWMNGGLTWDLERKSCRTA